MSINVAIIDDHKVVGNGLRHILNAFDHIHVLQVYNNGKELLEGLIQQQPDILLLDIQMGDMNGDEVAVIVNKTYPAVGIIALTSFDTTYHVALMLEKGAKGYVLKNTEELTLLEAIETVYKGEQFIDPGLRQQILQEVFKDKKYAHIPTLTRREKDVLKLIMEERTSQEIANILFLSLRTVENYRLNLMQKLHVKNTVGLVKAAIQMKLF